MSGCVEYTPGACKHFNAVAVYFFTFRITSKIHAELLVDTLHYIQKCKDNCYRIKILLEKEKL